MQRPADTTPTTSTIGAQYGGSDCQAEKEVENILQDESYETDGRQCIYDNREILSFLAHVPLICALYCFQHLHTTALTVVIY